MEWDIHEKKLLDYLADIEIEFPGPIMKPGLENALYSLSEHGIWPDSIDSVSAEQAVLCWRIIEKLKKKQFPSELCM